MSTLGNLFASTHLQIMTHDNDLLVRLILRRNFLTHLYSSSFTIQLKPQHDLQKWKHDRHFIMFTIDDLKCRFYRHPNQPCGSDVIEDQHGFL